MEVGPGPGQAEVAAAGDETGQLGRLLGRAAEAAHAGVDLEMDGQGRGCTFGQGPCQVQTGAADRAATGDRPPRIRGREAAHHQDAVGLEQVPDLGRLLERRNRQPPGPGLERRARHRLGAVAVAGSLDDRDHAAGGGEL